MYLIEDNMIKINLIFSKFYFTEFCEFLQIFVSDEKKILNFFHLPKGNNKEHLYIGRNKSVLMMVV